MSTSTTFAGLTLAGALTLALAPTASAAPADDAVGYLATQLEASGDRLTVESGGQTYDDLGLTIDAVLSMTAQGSGGDASAAATTYVVDHAGTYTGTGGEVYSAATAKLLTFTTARGLDPRDVGGTDLVAQLQGLEAPSGQFVDASQWGDYSNTLGQSFGVIGLERSGAGASDASVDFLLDQQCDDGGFSLEFTDGCVSDPDATSTVVQALDVVGGHDDVIGEAADYLETRQDDSGGVGGGTTTEAVNANSTGLAAVAFRIAGRDDARAAALEHLDGLTFGCDTPQLAGAIAYDRSGFEAATARGAAATPDGTITRSTAQALLGRTDSAYGDVSHQGQSPAAATADCATDDPTEGGGTPAPTEEPTDSTGTTPEIPAVVQTDGADGSVSAWPAGLVAGLGVAATLAVRRRAAQH